MSTIEEIEQAIWQLSRHDRAVVCARLAEADAEEWDSQFEADVKAGRVDWLAEEARRDLKAGRCTDR